MINLSLLRCEQSNRRNGKIKSFYFDSEDNIVASTCCTCGKVVEIENMCRSNKKKYGVDSRCKKCSKEYMEKYKFKYRRIDFSHKINTYLKRKHISNFKIERGYTKNGYSRVIIKNGQGEIKALSCSDCKKILDVDKFSKGGATDKTNYRGNCIRCQ